MLPTLGFFCFFFNLWVTTPVFYLIFVVKLHLKVLICHSGLLESLCQTSLLTLPLKKQLAR